MPLPAVGKVAKMAVHTRSPTKMNCQKDLMGKTAEGVEVDLYTLGNAHGLRVKIMTYGATIISVEAPDRHGKSRERHARAWIRWRTISRGIPASARPSAAMPTASPRASSASTASSTRWPRTTAPTTCTAASRVRQGRLEGRAGGDRQLGGRRLLLRKRRRRGRLSRQARRPQ